MVLNWRTPALALQARASLCADGVAAERVLLVDNGSGDESPRLLRGGADGSPVLTLTQNRGFAVANNLAATRLPAKECYLFVNADARVHLLGSVPALRARVARPGVAIAVPRLRNLDLSLQPTVVPLAAPWPELVRASGLSRLVPDRWQPALGTHWDHGASRPIQAADGAVLAVDARAFEALGGFTERTFMYGEDHALFRALRRAGQEAWFETGAEFLHVGCAASTQRWDDVDRAARVAHAEATLVLDDRTAAAWATVAAMAAGAGGRAVVRRVAGDRRAAARHAAQWRGLTAAAGEHLGRLPRAGPPLK